MSSELIETKVKLIELFKTWQGEGPDSGRMMLLLRFKYCNLNCPWCDTKIKMRVSEEAEYNLERIQKLLYENNCGLMITGGEPTIDRHFNDTLDLLNLLVYPIANIETNGFNLEKLLHNVLLQNMHKIKCIFSPKIFSPTDLETIIDKTKRLVVYDQVYMKIVYDGNKYVEKYFEWLAQEDLSHRVYLMPEGDTQEKLFKNVPKVFDLCERYNFNFSSRDHIIYGFL